MRAGRSVWLGSGRRLRLRFSGAVALVSAASLLVVPGQSWAAPREPAPGPASTSVVVEAVAVGQARPVGPHANVALEVSDSAAITGWAFNASTSTPQPGAEVRLEPGGLATTTDANGAYSFTGLTPGTYVLTATFDAGCEIAARTEVTVTTLAQADLFLQPATDSFGYGCQVFDQPFTPTTGPALPLTGNNNVTRVTLPFAFSFYGQTYTRAWVGTNGMLAFDKRGSSRPNNAISIPNAAAPNAVVAPFWDDLVVDGSASVHTATDGSAPFRQYVVEWRNVHRAGNAAERITAQVTLDETGFIFFNYSDLSTSSDPERGSEATIGIESPGGMVGLQYSFRNPVLADGKAVAFIPPISSNPI